MYKTHGHHNLYDKTGEPSNNTSPKMLVVGPSSSPPQAIQRSTDSEVSRSPHGCVLEELGRHLKDYGYIKNKLNPAKSLGRGMVSFELSLHRVGNEKMFSPARRFQRFSVPAFSAASCGVSSSGLVDAKNVAVHPGARGDLRMQSACQTRWTNSMRGGSAGIPQTPCA